MKVDGLQLLIALALIAFGVSLRLLPHPANFAPITAIAIFGGATLPRRIAMWVPLGAMMMSDMLIGFYNTVWVTWGCYLLIALAGSQWLRKPSLTQGVALTFSSSLFFFAATNLAVWLWGDMYAHTWAGFVQCYEMALPFFRNTALSDLFYGGLLFGIWSCMERGFKIATTSQAEGVIGSNPWPWRH